MSEIMRSETVSYLIEMPLATGNPLAASPDFEQVWTWFCGSTTVTQGSLRAYRQGVEQLRGWCQEHGVGIRELAPNDLIRFRSEVSGSGLAASTVNIRLTGIRQFLLWLVDEGFGSERLSEDRIRRYLKSPKVPEQEMPFLTSVEVQDFLLAALDADNADRDYQLFTVMLNTGLRLNEVLNLRLGDIEQVEHDEGILTVRKGKGGNPRRFRVPPAVVKTVEYRKKDLKLRWDDREDRERKLFEMSHGNLRKLVKRTGKRAKIQKPVTPHTLRHTFGVHFQGPIELLQQILGHRDLKTTLRYRHANFLAYGTSYSLGFWNNGEKLGGEQTAGASAGIHIALR